MNLEKLYENRFGEFPLRNITWGIIAGQVLAYITLTFYPGLLGLMHLKGSSLISGEIWRLFTFLIIPIGSSPIWVVLSWYAMYIFGTALEQTWGAFRYFLYLLVGYAASLVAAFLFPDTAFSNGYVFGSLFLAFAYLNPDFTVYVFFIFPVKVKWLAYLTWFGIMLSFLTGSVTVRIQTLLLIANFLAFFGRDIMQRAQGRARRISSRQRERSISEKTYMKCVNCGATERNDKIFYTCRECNPFLQFCEDHINNHRHKVIH